MTCETCGAAEWSAKDGGLTIQITRKAENNFQRDRKLTVWVCCRECGVQALAIAKYGPNTRNWPVTLAQFRSTKPLDAAIVTK